MNAKQSDTLDNASLQQLAAKALTRYPDALQGELALICRSENATFVVKLADGNRLALRVHRDDYHQRNEIESELAWLDALRETGIQVPEALVTQDGERVQTLSLGEGASRHVVLFKWIEGEMPTTEIDPRAFAQLGEVTARLHQHSQRWQKPSGFKRIVWDHQTMTGEKGHWGRWQDAPGLQPKDHPIVEETLRRVSRILEKYGKSSQRYGLIHADLRLTNLLLHKGETRVIDFDDCGMGWYMHDAAAAISFVEHHPRASEWVEHWLAGYQRVCALSEDCLAVIPTMIIQRRIQLLAWVGSHATTEMALSLGDNWVADSLKLCQAYLATEQCALAVS
ncbi:phosphotransferase [Rouxiella badensis]|uniref:phosphotransferase enzyme family protein n=1 Tax=Rouxiella badensis TaxID=1646377 RepID=UPI00037F2804|nr:phosphotransferase [Rouxiella badensis]MCC3702127.1 phosphotransferase [Rouxiella badensis]MCC3717133.1 phosphotransferase [Rouxiella badensis]MCC3728229.1 phosphotransferase [Rouxiella badensis]MCC3732133.1 phosphotransferase [Rouxiella badensis]MCC3739973.1 phosphotransferase [Rouxiella badensis]